MKLKVKAIDSFAVGIICFVIAVVCAPPGFRLPDRDYSLTIILALLFAIAGIAFLALGLIKIFRR